MSVGVDANKAESGPYVGTIWCAQSSYGTRGTYGPTSLRHTGRMAVTLAISSNSRAIHSLDTTTKDGIYPAVSPRFAARRMKPARARVAFQCSPLSNAFTGLCQSPARENAPNKGSSRTIASEYMHSFMGERMHPPICLQGLISRKSANRLPGLLFHPSERRHPRHKTKEAVDHVMMAHVLLGTTNESYVSALSRNDPVNDARTFHELLCVGIREGLPFRSASCVF